MNKIIPLAFALVLPSIAYTTPLSAAPATTPAPTIDPAAVALLNDSAKAYAELSGLSMNYTSFEQKGQKSSNLKGTISYSGADKANVTIKGDDSMVFNMTDGKKLYTQVDATTVQGTAVNNGVARAMVLARIPTAASVPLPALIGGNSPLSLEFMKWQSAQLLPSNGVKLIAAPGGPALTFDLYFDPSSKLLRRVEFASENEGVKRTNITILSNVEANPAFASDSFTFTAGNGMKEVSELPMFDPRLQVGASPFELMGKDLSGKAHSWKQYAGKVVLLDFWATWCGPCVGELPNVLKNYKTYHPKGMEIIGVSLDNDKKALTDFLKTRDLKYTNLYDGKGWGNVDAKNYGVRGVPFTLLIGKDGKIAAVNPRGEKLEPALIKALGQS
ncbi:redoxin domain-containing protein [bacterium]|nr:MAG: redoxin domain-containing protein [bacterium]